MDKIEKLSVRLQSLAVFRELLSDDVISALSSFLAWAGEDESLSVSAYSEFVSLLYKTDTADLALHVKEIVESSENVYTRLIGCKKTPDINIEKAVLAELDILQCVADITADTLRGLSGFKGELPGFSSSKVDIRKSFTDRVKNISKYGYGMYAKSSMFYIDEDNRIVPVKNPDSITFADLVDYENERKVIYDNTRALVDGRPAANILLTGDAGTGKSSTIKAVANALFADGIRIIEVRKQQLLQIPKVLDELAINPLKFILFIDDLSFQKDDDSFNALKAVLEGSVSAKSKNVVIYATSNRRHMVKERFSDREGDEVHRNDAMQELISLSERFGIHVTFQKPGKATFLRIVHHLAEENGIKMDASELELLAERFALERGGRSPRLAKQFIDRLISAEK